MAFESFHAADGDVYHQSHNCPDAADIPLAERISGRGGKRPCPRCSSQFVDPGPSFGGGRPSGNE